MSGLSIPSGSIPTTSSGNSTVSGGESTGSTSGTSSGVAGTRSNTPVPDTGGGSNIGNVNGLLPPLQQVENSLQQLGGSLKDLEKQLKVVQSSIASLTSIFSSIKNPDLLAAILIEMSAMQRQNSLDQRLASRETAKSQLEGQAAEMRDAAIKEIAAAAVAVVMAVVSFAVAIGGAVKMGKEIKGGMENSKVAQSFSDKASDVMDGKDLKSLTDKEIKQLEFDTKKLENDAKHFDRLADGNFRTSDKLNMQFTAIRGLLDGMASGISSTLNAFAKFDEAEGQMLAANAQDTQADADQMKEFIGAIEELVKTAIQFIQQLHEAEVELMASASRL